MLRIRASVRLNLVLLALFLFNVRNAFSFEADFCDEPYEAACTSESAAQQAALELKQKLESIFIEESTEVLRKLNLVSPQNFNKDLGSLLDEIEATRGEEYISKKIHPLLAAAMEKKIIEISKNNPEKILQETQQMMLKLIESMPHLSNNKKREFGTAVSAVFYYDLEKMVLNGDWGNLACPMGIGLQASLDPDQRKKFHLCPGLLLLNQGTSSVGSTGHELGHAVSHGEFEAETRALVECSNTYLGSTPKWSKETISDFFEAELLAVKLGEIKDQKTRRDLLKRELAIFCLVDPFYKEFKNRWGLPTTSDPSDSYGHMPTRLKILMRNKNLRKVMGCSDPTPERPSCDFGGKFPK